MAVSNNITKSAFWTILTQIPAHLFGLIAGVFITRILGPEGKGEYTLFFSNIDLFTTIFGFSIINSIIFFTANEKIHHFRLRKIVAIILTSTLLLSTIIALVIANSDFHKLFLPRNIEWLQVTSLFVLTILIIQINATFTAYFQGLRHFKTANKMLIYNGFVSVIIFGTSYYLHQQHYYSIQLIDIIYLSILILLINSSYWIYHYSKIQHDQVILSSPLKEDIKLLSKFTTFNHLSNILVFLNNKIILWFVLFYLDHWQLGIFSLGLGVAQLIFFFSNPLSMILESFISSNITTNKRQLFSMISRIQFSIILSVCALLLVLSPTLIPWVYGKEFTGSVSLIQIILIGVLFASQALILSSYFLATNRLKFNISAAATGLLTTIIIAPIFIQKFGLLGAAYTQVITYLASYVVLLILFITKDKHDINLFILKKSDLKLMLRQIKSKQTN